MLATTPWAMNSCSECRSPPQKKHMPSTSSRLEKTLPIRLVCTMRKSFASSAWTATTSSTALPKVALRRPPITSLVCAASSSVKTPSIEASGTMARKVMTKMLPSDQPAMWDQYATGRRAKRTLTLFSVNSSLSASDGAGASVAGSSSASLGMER